MTFHPPQTLRDLAPELATTISAFFPWISISASLWWFRDSFLWRGTTKGDPLGPLLFCLTIHSLVPAEFRVLLFVWHYLLAGVEQIFSTLTKEFGLELNRSKSEVICKDHTTLGSLLVEIPGLTVVDPPCWAPPLVVLSVGSMQLFSSPWEFWENGSTTFRLMMLFAFSAMLLPSLSFAFLSLPDSYVISAWT